MTRKRGIPTTTEARTLADMGWGTERTRSDLERDFLALLRAHGLSPPEVNARIGPYEVDFLWRTERLIVELDGYAYHSSRAQFESDRRRDREFQRMGFVVLRFADRELSPCPPDIANFLRS